MLTQHKKIHLKQLELDREVIAMLVNLEMRVSKLEKKSKPVKKTRKS